MPKISPGFWTQGPNDFKDYFFDFGTEWLAEIIPPDTIGAAICTVDDPSLTLSGQLVSSQAVVIYVSGGIVGRIYTVECQITTAAGRRETTSIKIWIRDPP